MDGGYVVKMGLTVSHGAFEGPYSSFYRMRKAIAEAADGRYTTMDEAFGTYQFDDTYLGGDERLVGGLVELLSHSDFDGEIGPQKCGDVADAVEMLLPHIENNVAGNRKMTMRNTVRTFIEGCRRAHAAGEVMTFG